MKSFDLKAALSGELIESEGCTYRFSEFDHRYTRLIFKRTDGCGQVSVDLNGMGYVHAVYMAPRKVKKTVWVNLSRDIPVMDRSYNAVDRGMFGAYSTAAEAKAAAIAQSVVWNYIATAIPVEIEVEE